MCCLYGIKASTIYTQTHIKEHGFQRERKKESERASERVLLEKKNRLGSKFSKWEKKQRQKKKTKG